MNNLCFLFGAGTSIGAGLPSTEEITEIIFKGEIKSKIVRRYSNERYGTGPCPFIHNNIEEKYVPRILKFLQRMKREIDSYYSYWPERYTTYEDLYYMAMQINDSETEEYDNPAVQPLVDIISKDIEPFIKKRQDEIACQHWDISVLSKETTIYIENLLHMLLSKKTIKFDYLNWFIDAFKDDAFSKIDIFTLNHDLVFDLFLSETKIAYYDGFGYKTNDIRYWQKDLLDIDKKEKIKLIKLHGAINWYRFSNGKEDIIGSYSGSDVDHAYDKYGKRLYLHDSKPILLVGTFNKMYSYVNSSLFIYLYFCMYRYLELSNRLIVSGYSFGDKGINSRVIEWLLSSDNNKMIIIDPNLKELVSNSRGSIRHKWDNLINIERIRTIEKRIEDVTWEEIKTQI